MFTRALQIPLEQRKSFFLFGPRGTGKTTGVTQRVTDALYINLLRSDLYLPRSVNPAHLRALIRERPADAPARRGSRSPVT